MVADPAAESCGAADEREDLRSGGNDKEEVVPLPRSYFIY
jgi:hypothetical protein